MNRLVILLAAIFIFASSTEVYAANSPSVYFDPGNIVLNKTDTKSVDLYLDSGLEEITGVDLIIIYDSDKIEITSIDTLNKFDQKTKQVNEPGKIKIAFSNNYGKYIFGNSKFATLNIKTKSINGNTKIYFDFEEGQTNDTNLVSKNATDVLQNAGELNIEINDNKEETGLSVSPTPKAKSNKNIAAIISPSPRQTATPASFKKEEVLGTSEINKETGNETFVFPWQWLLIFVSFILFGFGTFILGKSLSSQKQINNYN